MTRWERWVVAWGHLIDGVTGVLTFAYWRTSFGVDAIVWGLGRECKRYEEGE